MSIRDFSQNLQILYKEMSGTFSAYQASTGLHCLPDCGRCCLNPDIEASVLEMIPFALKAFDEDKIDYWLNELKTTEQQSCVVFMGDKSSGLGKCGSYETRPSICRMFGVSGYFNKQHKATLSVCKFIKEQSPDLVTSIEKKTNLENTPMLVYWSQKLADLNPQLIQERMPINQAMERALEKIALYAQYQEL
jgi:Fe-S-cluster containining protein